MTFNDFNLKASLAKNIQRLGFDKPTEVQSEAIPLLLNNKDVLAVAQTGTGKTAAFLLPILNSILPLSKYPIIKALILAPTRELAIQIGTMIEQLSQGTDIRHAVLIGGDPIEEQIYLIERGIDIVVGTPGRVSHLQKERLINLRRVEWFVIDEGDRMLDMGFIGVIRKIAFDLPRKRHSALFSATLQDDTIKLAKDVLYRPAKIQLAPAKPDLSLVKQTAYYVDSKNKFNLLSYLLKENNISSALIFVRTKNDAEQLTQALCKEQFNAISLHGNLLQEDRHRSLRRFSTEQGLILVATDIAARGLDIEGLEWIFNHDIPSDPTTYIHRIGRTGRAGKSGSAISLCSNAELRFLKPIKKLVGKNNLQIIEKHPFSYEPRKKDNPQPND